MNIPPADVGEVALAGSPTSPNRPRIVVGLDGSASSDKALRYATRLAKALNASIEGVVAWAYPIALSASVLNALPNIESDARDAASGAADRVFGTLWPEWFTIVVREGNTAHVLMTESENAEMLVLGSRGHGGFAGLLLGSVSAECAEHATCPVLVVHDSVTS